jgi:hypothetical protein
MLMNGCDGMESNAVSGSGDMLRRSHPYVIHIEFLRWG